MAQSYSGDPSKSAKDATRFLCGDTNTKDFLLNDEEILYFLAQYNNTPLNAAIRCCETIAAKYARMSDETVGAVKILYSQKAKGYYALKEQLICRLCTEDATPYAGGISIADKQANQDNSDRVRPDFDKHQMENRDISPWVSNAQNEWFWW